MSEHYTFAIIGAGPAGSTCANVISQNGAASVVLIDRDCFPRDKVCGDGIGPGVISILESLGMEGILKGHSRVTQMAMTGPLGGRMSLDATKIDRRSPLGYVIARISFDTALLKTAVDLGTSDMTGWSLETLSRDCDRWHLKLSNTHTGETRTITANVLIGADGARSRVRRYLGQNFNNDQHTSIAIRVLAEASPPLPAHQQLNVVDGIPIPGYGWLFSNGQGKANIGVGTDIPAYKGQKRHLKQILGTYKDFLGDQFAYDEATCRTQILPLGSQMPPLAYPDVGAALIGDAASMINPLTGEGIFYAMAAGQLLGRSLTDAQYSGRHSQALLAYERRFLATFKSHFRGNYLLRRMLERPILLDQMLRACSKSSDLCCDYIEYMMGNETGVGTKPLYRLALDTVVAQLRLS